MANNDGLNDRIDGMLPATLPSGAVFYVHDKEFQYFQDRARKYTSDNDFQNISDLQDVDRLIILELLCYRNGVWASQLRDYWDEPVDEVKLQRMVADHSAEIRQLKKNLGLDRETREKLRGEDSVDNYLAKLRQRAKHFGYMRNEQSAKAIELWKTLESLIVFHDNCDEKERIELQIGTEDVLRWIREEAFPDFNEIDENFRATEQKMWQRDQ